MLTSADVKRAATSMGADLVGISPMERFEGAPPQTDPRYIFPEAKALIGLAFRMPRGYLRRIAPVQRLEVTHELVYGVQLLAPS